MFDKLFRRTKSPVTYAKDDDAEMSKAFEDARNNLQSFWHQVSLDFNRIVPALEMACIKAQFSDKPSNPDSPVEHMWVNNIDFDGSMFTGVLLNAPNNLKKYKPKDTVSFPRSQISDWLCVLEGKTYGGYTVQLVRRRMNPQDRQQFDAAWGLNSLLPKQY